MPSQATPQDRLDIVQRHMGFSFPKDLPRLWNGDDAFDTQLFNALSLTFPKGEQMFIDSVRFYREHIHDAALSDDVRAFIGQEAQHSKEHEAFNAWIAAQGYPVDDIYAFIDERQELGRAAPPIVQLAITCALEHFTAIMADSILEDEALIAAIHEDVRALWIWHAIEETEHKAVAFDVYAHVGGSLKTRRITMAYITFHFITNITRFHLALLKADGELSNLPALARGVWRHWGPRGRFTKLIPAYLAYYRADFHPWQQDNRSTVAKWKAYIDGIAKRRVPQRRDESKREAA